MRRLRRLRYAFEERTGLLVGCYRFSSYSNRRWCPLYLDPIGDSGSEWWPLMRRARGVGVAVFGRAVYVIWAP